MAEIKMPLYKGKPLVRSGNTVYYGHPAEKYVAMLQILGTSGEVAGVPISDRVKMVCWKGLSLLQLQLFSGLNLF